MADGELPKKHALFVSEYMVDGNATKAAIRAGYSETAARQQGGLLLSRPEIKAAIDKAFAEKAERNEIGVDEVLSGLVDQYRADIVDLFTESGAIRDVESWPTAFRRGLVKAVKVTEMFQGQGQSRVKVGQTVEVKLESRLKVVELIGKQIGMFGKVDKTDLLTIGALQAIGGNVGMTPSEK